MIKTAMCCLALVAASAPRAWAEAAPSQQMAVPISDLDLSDEADVELLMQRISRAAADLCGRPGEIVHQRELRWMRACAAEATAESVARLDHPALSALHARQLAAR